MYVKYGTYEHTDNLVGFSFVRTANVNPRTGLPLSHVVTVKMDGELHASTQATMKTAIEALEAAYSANNQAWALYHDDDTISAHSLPLTGLLRPITVVQPPSFDTSDGSEYATRRRYTITLEAEYAAATSQIVEWSEQISIRGTGGPKYITSETIFGFPVRDQVTVKSISSAVQSGRAVGFSAYPVPATPMWPQHEDVDRRVIATQTPTQQSGFVSVRYPISWNYEFTSPFPLTGTPVVP